MYTRPALLLIVIAAMLLAACAPVQTSPIVSQPGSTGTASNLTPGQEASTAAARSELASLLGVSQEKIVVREAAYADWPDPCLGIPDPLALCAMVVTPGYRVVLEVQGETYVFRTDLEGQTVRQERTDPAEEAAAAAVNMLAEQLSTNPAAISVMKVREANWPDPCLGLAGPAELCAMVVTPGFQIELLAGEETYVFRTNLEGTEVREERLAPETAAVEAATANLAEILGIDEVDISVMQVSSAVWPDPCLGLAGPAELCAMVETPGYRVDMMAGKTRYFFRTNKDGSEVRQERGAPGTNIDEIPEAAVAAVEALAAEMDVPSSVVSVIHVSEVEWSDGCLEIVKPGMMCTMATVPGYLIILEVEGAQYEIRTDRDGGLVVFAGKTSMLPPPPRLDEK